MRLFRVAKAAWLLLVPLCVHIQPVADARPAAAAKPRISQAGEAGPAAAIPQGQIVREIDDPGNGDRWLLSSDPSHPGGPGMLVRVGSELSPPATASSASGAVIAEGPAPAGGPAARPAPIIRGGDRIVVAESTAVADVRLEAVAMGPAAAGSPFRARLSIGGRMVRALAVRPGYATFAALLPDLTVEQP